MARGVEEAPARRAGGHGREEQGSPAPRRLTSSSLWLRMPRTRSCRFLSNMRSMLPLTILRAIAAARELRPPRGTPPRPWEARGRGDHTTGARCAALPAAAERVTWRPERRLRPETSPRRGAAKAAPCYSPLASELRAVRKWRPRWRWVS